MNRIAWAGVGAVAIAAGFGWMALRDGSPPTGSTDAVAIGPKAVAVGETSKQIWTNADGEPEVWTLRKRQADREVLAAELLPAPAPRQEPPDERTDSARALNDQALEAWKTGRLTEALEFFESAVATDPDDWRPRSDYSRLLLMMTDYARAGPHLERAVELNPDSARVWLDLYSYYQRSLQLERGFHAYEKAKELAGGEAIVQDETGLWRLESDSIYP